MNNPNSSPAPVHPLIPCLAYVREHIRKIDREGLIILDQYVADVHGDLTEITDPALFMQDLTDTLCGRFNFDVVDLRPADTKPEDTVPNYEDRLRAFDVLDRAMHFGPVAYAGEFLRLAPYILRNIQSA